MLTTWKQTRTSIEYTTSTASRGQESTKKKKKSKQSLSAESSAAALSQDVAVGAQFVRPLARGDPFYQERASNSSKNRNKRRKSNNVSAARGASSGASSGDADAEPVLCLTSPHRVVFLGKGGEGSGSAAGESSLIESKSRNYVARPGAGSRFSLRGIATPSTSSNGTAFAGMFPPGARYDPASNLIYTIRNSGAEVAVWTAAPSSVLAGPDEEGSSEVMNERKKIRDHHRNDTMPKGPGSKRKLQQQEEARGSSLDAIISERLQLPKGKRAATQTPFSIVASSSKGKEWLAAVGAAGCCDDGSIWVAICFPSDESRGQFQLLMIEGSSLDSYASAAKAKKRRKSVAKTEGGKSGWALLDSCATGTAAKSGASVLLTVQSVILSEDKKAQLALRHHQVRVHKGESGEAKLSVHVEKSTKHDILQLETPRRDIAVKLDANSDSLSIIHRKGKDRWMFTSVDISRTDGALINSTRAFLLPFSDMSGAPTVCSFGGVGENVVAVLIKSQSPEQPGISVLSLRIIDFRRKAELSSQFWMEGEYSEDEETPPAFRDSVLNKILRGKQCHAMVTNELDGSIALLASPREDKGSLDIIYTKLEMDSTRTRSAPTASSGASLALSLRLVATSASNPIDEKKSNKSKRRPTVNLTDAFSGKADDNYAHQSVVDNAVDEACKLLATSARELVELSTISISDAEDRSVTNGKCRKGAKAGKRFASSMSWTEVYREGSLMITEAKGGKPVYVKKNLINGIRGGVTTPSALKLADTDELPKRFVEVAFKESATLLLSLHKEAESTKLQEESQKTIRAATSVLINALQTNLISARTDYDIGVSHNGIVLSSILQACPPISLKDIGNGTVGKLHVIDAMLEHVQDIPEGLLVSILRFVLRRVTAEDAIAYYSTNPNISKKGSRLSNQFRESTDQEDTQKQIGTRLISEAVLDFTSKIVTYSNCNNSFLTKAMLDSVNGSAEVETLLLTLAKLLKLGSTHKLREGSGSPHTKEVSLSAGTIHWISALTDAHMNTVLKITNEGGLVIDRIQNAVRSAMAQSEFANETRDITDLLMPGEAAEVVTKSSAADPRSRDTAVAPYTLERLAF